MWYNSSFGFIPFSICQCHKWNIKKKMCLYPEGMRGHQLIYEILPSCQNLLSLHSRGQVCISRLARSNQVLCVCPISHLCQIHDPRHPRQLSSVLVMLKVKRMLSGFKYIWFNNEFVPKKSGTVHQKIQLSLLYAILYGLYGFLHVTQTEIFYRMSKLLFYNESELWTWLSSSKIDKKHWKYDRTEPI